jgi:hypothetical protein
MEVDLQQFLLLILVSFLQLSQLCHAQEFLIFFERKWLVGDYHLNQSTSNNSSLSSQLALNHLVGLICIHPCGGGGAAFPSSSLFSSDI